ncbi:MAG TPA: hypothetical protein ENN19_12390 [Chloroflexi bacterium]|nr:hypothetical protein [Chloroflexota bacterium]
MTKIWLLGFTLIILFGLLLGSVAVFEWHYAERIYPGVSVWSVDVGGLLVEESASALTDRFGLNEPFLILHGPGQSWTPRPADLGLQLERQATLDSAYQIGRGPSWTANLRTHLELLLDGKDLPPTLVYDEQVTRLYLETLAKQIDVPAIDAALNLQGITPVTTPAQDGHYLDVDASLAALKPAVMQLRPAEVSLVGYDVPAVITDAETARVEIEKLLAGPLTLLLAQPREDDAGPWIIQPEDLATMLDVQTQDGVLRAAVNQAALQTYLRTLTETLFIEPVDARFHFNDERGQLEPISPSVKGRALDVTASAARIIHELEAGTRHVPLVVQEVPPRYPDTATAEELGIVELVAEGDSYFIDSPSARDHNIRIATPKFDGIVIGPGETFSFNHYLGPVTEAAGYDKSYVTAGEQLAIEIGGGICQVSTTVFRATFWGGYPITERWYHNHRVGYYELMGAGLGMDATVYSPVVDFKFVNDRPHPLLIETEIKDGAHRLIFRFYSTDDGRTVEKEGPEITDRTQPGPPIYQLDPSMAAGTVVRWQSATAGLTATIQRRVLDADGNVIYEDVFVSKYAARRAAYHHGPDYEPPASGEPEMETTD